MGNIQKHNQPLIASTNPQQRLTESKQSFESFVKVFADCGGRVNETTIRLMKKSIDNNNFSVADIEAAVIKCFEYEQFFNWANVKKYIDAEDELLDNNKLRLMLDANE